jgi:hypothetical protein
MLKYKKNKKFNNKKLMTSMMYFWITWQNKINNLFKYLVNKINNNQNKNN